MPLASFFATSIMVYSKKKCKFTLLFIRSDWNDSNMTFSNLIEPEPNMDRKKKCLPIRCL